MSFLSDVIKFEKFNLKDMWGKIKDDPERLLLGALDPFSTRMWNKTGIGKDWEPVVDQFGGAYGGNALGGGNEGVYGRAQAAGINTGPGSQMHDVARAVTSLFAGGYGADKLGAMGGGGSSNFLSRVPNLPNLQLPGGQSQSVPPPPPFIRSGPSGFLPVSQPMPDQNKMLAQLLFRGPNQVPQRNSQNAQSLAMLAALLRGQNV